MVELASHPEARTGVRLERQEGNLMDDIDEVLASLHRIEDRLEGVEDRLEALGHARTEHWKSWVNGVLGAIWLTLIVLLVANYCGR